MDICKFGEHEWQSAGEASMSNLDYDWCERCGTLRITEHGVNYTDTKYSYPSIYARSHYSGLNPGACDAKQ